MNLRICLLSLMSNKHAGSGGADGDADTCCCDRTTNSEWSVKAPYGSEVCEHHQPICPDATESHSSLNHVTHYLPTNMRYSRFLMHLSCAKHTFASFNGESTLQRDLGRSASDVSDQWYKVASLPCTNTLFFLVRDGTKNAGCTIKQFVQVECLLAVTY